MQALGSPAAAPRKGTRRCVASGAVLTALAAAFGLAGALTPLLKGTASNGTVSATLEMGFLRSCTDCGPCPGFIVPKCTDNFGSGGLGGPELQVRWC